MAAADTTISIELEIKQALDRVRRLERQMLSTGKAIDRAAFSTKNFEKAIDTARFALGGFVAYLSGDRIKQASDGYVSFTNKVRIATSSVAEQEKVQKELFKVAQRSGTPLDHVARLYGRIRIAAGQLNSTQMETIRVVETVVKSLAATGSPITEVQGALLQLGQAFGAPLVQAQEFNSLIDGMPNLLREVEKDLGIQSGALKRYVNDQKLSNKQLFQSILASDDAIENQFQQTSKTVSRAMVEIANAFSLAIGKLEQATGIFSGMASRLSSFAGNAETADEKIRKFAAGVILARDALKELGGFAKTALSPLANVLSGAVGNEENTLLTTLNYLRAGFQFLGVAAKYEFENASIQAELWGLRTKDFFMGILYDMMSFFEGVDNFFIEQLNKVIDGYNYLAESLPWNEPTISSYGETSNEWEEIRLRFETDTAMEMSAAYKRAAENFSTYEEALRKVADGFHDMQNEIDAEKLGAVAEALGEVDLNSRAAAEAIDGAIKALDKDSAFTAIAGGLTQAFEAAYDESTPLLARAKELEAFVNQINIGLVKTETQDIIAPGHLEATKEVLTEMLVLSRQMSSEGFQLGFDMEGQEEYEDSMNEVFNLEKKITAEAKERDRLKYYTLWDSLVNAVKEVLGIEEEITKEKEKQKSYDEERVEVLDYFSGQLVSGVSNAGPNASRGVSAMQAGASMAHAGPQAAAGAMVLDMVMSNEKVAKAIDTSFSLFFQIFDPFLDIIGDLITAINSLIGAVLSAANDAISSAFENFNLTNGNATQYVEQALSNFGAFIGADMGINHGYRGWDLDGDGVIKAQKSLLQNIFENIETVFEEGFRASNPSGEFRGLLGPGGRDRTDFELTAKTIEDFTKSVQKIGFAETMKNTTDILGEAFDAINTLYIHGYDKDKVSKNAKEVEEILTELLTDAYFKNVTANILEEVSNIQTSITDQIERMEFNALTAGEQSVQMHLDRMDALAEQRLETYETIEVEEHRTEVLAAIKEAEAASIALLNKQKEELKLLNEERERELVLLQQNSAISVLERILNDFEKTMKGIGELVEGLFDQVSELLLSEFNLAPATEKLEIASSKYQKLLESAFAPDATEEDIENLQGFVNEYLKSARDVYKSSSTFQAIFASVLDDLSMLGVTSGFNMSGGAVSDATGGIKEFIETTQELDEGLRKTLEFLIRDLKDLGTAFQEQQLDFITSEDGLDIPMGLVGDDFKPILNGQIDLALTQDDIGSIGFFDEDGKPLKLDFTETATFTVTAVGNLTGFTKEDGTALAEGATEGWATLIGNASFSSNFAGMGKTAADATEYIGYASFDASLSGMGETSYTAYYGYASFAAVMSGMTADPSNPASIRGYVSAAITATISTIDASKVEETITDTIQGMLDSIERTFSGLGQLTSYYSSNVGAYTQHGVSQDGSMYAKHYPHIDPTYNEALRLSGVVEGSRAHFGSLAQELVDERGTDVFKTNPYVVTRESPYDVTVFAYTNVKDANEMYNSDTTFSGASFGKYGFRYGGMVHPQDTIPAMLSPGEYILSPETVKRFGVGSLNQLNSGDSSAVSQTNDPEVKRLLSELIVAVREQDSEVHVYTDMEGQAKAAISDFRSELKEKTRRQGDKYVQAQYI